MRKLLLLPFTFLIVVNCHAQFIKTLGVKVGATQSRFTHSYRLSSFDPGDYTDKSGIKTGFTAMIAADFIQKKYWDFNSSIGYVQKCSYRMYPDYNKPSYRIDYISILNSIRGKIPVSNVVNFYGQVGLRYDYQIYQHGQFVRINSKPDLNNTYGLNTGAGISYRYEKVILSGEASRNFNFNKVCDIEGLGQGNDDLYYKLSDDTWLFYVSVSYVFMRDSEEGK